MLKKYVTLGLMTCTLGISGLAHAQAAPTASSSTQLQLGVGGSYLNTDYGQKSDKSLNIYGDFDRTRHLGLEGDANFIISSPQSVKESSYMGGLRLFNRKGRYTLYGKGMAGVANFNFFNSVNNGSYFIFAVGAGLDIKATRRINVRAFDFTTQEWTTFSPNNLSPYTITVGAAYSFR